MSEGKPIVLFNLKAGVAEERRAAILAEVKAWSAIEHAGPLLPDSPVETLRLAQVATLEREADAEEVVDRLHRIPEIESASAPAPRHLVG